MISLQVAVELFAYRLQHGVGNANVEFTAITAYIEFERCCNNNLGRCCDTGELRIHFRADIFESDRIDGFPGIFIIFEQDFKQAPNDALFGQGEFPSFHSGMETSVSSEHVVYDQKYQVRIKYNQCSATQWLHADHVDIRRYCQR